MKFTEIKDQSCPRTRAETCHVFRSDQRVDGQSARGTAARDLKNYNGTPNHPQAP